MYLYLDMSIASICTNSIAFPHPARLSSHHTSLYTLWAVAWAEASLSRPEAVVTAQAQDFQSLSPSKPSLSRSFQAEPSRHNTRRQRASVVIVYKSGQLRRISHEKEMKVHKVVVEFHK
jgi:hypothetical protein